MQMYPIEAATVQLKKLGKGDVVHHTPLDPNDITTLYESGTFDQSTPGGLQKKCGLSLWSTSVGEVVKTWGT